MNFKLFIKACITISTKTFIYLFVCLHMVQKYWLKIAQMIYFKKQWNALPANLNIWVEVILLSCLRRGNTFKIKWHIQAQIAAFPEKDPATFPLYMKCISSSWPRWNIYLPRDFGTAFEEVIWNIISHRCWTCNILLWVLKRFHRI